MTSAMFAAAIAWALTDAPAAGPAIEVEQALVTLIEQVEVPAREAGVLFKVAVREGDLVREGAELARLEDTQAELAKKRARIELDIARAEAENDVNVRFARKSTEVARAELKRASESVEKYNRSISVTEIERLRLQAERAALEVEQADRDQKISQFTEHLKQNELDFANFNAERLRITAPVAGVVVQINRRAGEWVEPGQAVLRILRIDRLRVEAFLDARQATIDLQGAAVRLRVESPDRPGGEFAGKVVFVSPEIDPVNGQVRVWAEVENVGMQLRPGQRATMEIEPGRPAAESP